tara:strand:- start:477 stop:683 length:207 start_codon:yes stop_codon:yes gene_type:complete
MPLPAIKTNAIHANSYAQNYVRALHRMESDRTMPRKWKEALLNHINSVEAFEGCIKGAIEAAAKNQAA